MECNRIQDRLVDYVTEETRITERLCVEVHLATCYRCREALDEVHTVLDSARAGAAYPGPMRSFDSAMNEIYARSALARAQSSRPQHRWSWGVAAAAIPILVACATPFLVAWPERAEVVQDADGRATPQEHQVRDAEPLLMPSTTAINGSPYADWDLLAAP